MSFNCVECGRDVDPCGEDLTEDQYFLCQTCAQRVTVSPGAVIVPLLKPVFKKITVSIEEHQALWLEKNPRVKASHLLRDAIEARI